MKTNPIGMDTGMMNANPMLAWWQEQWMKGANPMAQMQAAWMESLADAMKFEAQFLMAIAETGQEMTECLHNEKPATAEEVQACYQKLVKQVTDAQHTRMEHAAQLSHDFRKRLWEEI
ncbi:MAG: hypothetical protein IBX53_02045 [Halomonas sp.]|uniref:hypothetical protein n=1 Tax=Halomonas sp. TaxID=1486246 RepID=UPI001A1051E4|nr:hypothetical protein [Halomonas sp.]MBE0487833.1 hypothetical protein [Halomonas sp.]